MVLDGRFQLYKKFMWAGINLLFLVSWKHNICTSSFPTNFLINFHFILSLKPLMLYDIIFMVHSVHPSCYSSPNYPYLVDLYFPYSLIFSTPLLRCLCRTPVYLPPIPNMFSICTFIMYPEILIASLHIAIWKTLFKE